MAGLRTSDMTERNRRFRRMWLPIGVASAVLAGGVLWLISRDPATIDRHGSAPVVSLAGVTGGSPVTTAVESPVAPPATTSREAVQRYLDAEAAGQLEDSYAQLSATDRQDIGDSGDWRAASEERPRFDSFEIIEATDTKVVVEAHPRPMVSEIDGVAPMSERVEFTTRAEDGGVRIALAETTYAPTYPSPEPAAGVATQWIAGQQACSAATTAPLEYDGNLLGTLGLAQSLCGARGTPSVVGTGGLEALADPSPVLNAFGEQATEWTRVVDVGGIAGESRVQVILAPYGDRWVVVGGLATIGSATG